MVLARVPTIRGILSANALRLVGEFSYAFAANKRDSAAQCCAELASNWTVRGSSAFKDSGHPGCDGRGDAEVAMTKLMLAVGILCSLILYDPARVINNLGPEAQRIGWMIKSSLSTERAMPQVASFVRGH
jgi:hypothetical protein